MKVLLVHPPAMEIYGRFKPAAKLAAQPQMPLGILYVAGALEREGHVVRIIDGDVDELTPPAILAEIAAWHPDVVGVSATTPVYAVAREILKRAKQTHPRVVTLIGGFHFTALPEATMAECAADYGVYGEGEHTIVALVRALERGEDVADVAGVLYRRDGVVCRAPARAAISELDALALPARHLLRHRRYVWSVPHKGLVPVTTIMTQRGCPYPCVFCGVQTMFPKVRYRSVERIVDELEHIVNDLGIGHVQFSDDTLTLKASKVVAMCHEIRRRKLRVTWEGYTRSDRITRDLLQLMKAAGLVRLSFGVESGDQTVLDGTKKGTKLEEYRRAYEWCEELGLETRCSVMLGNAFETHATVRRTIAFIRSLRVYQAYINIATPYPGTTLLDMARRGVGRLRLLTEDWAEYRRYGNAVMEVNDLTREDLVRLQRQAYLEFYLRPRIIWKNIARAGVQAAWHNARGFVLTVLNPFAKDPLPTYAGPESMG